MLSMIKKSVVIQGSAKDIHVVALTAIVMTIVMIEDYEQRNLD